MPQDEMTKTTPTTLLSMHYDIECANALWIKEHLGTMMALQLYIEIGE